jgi:5-methylcytosine-specific restriction endonuclease McrA
MKRYVLTKNKITGKKNFYQSTRWRKVRLAFIKTTNGLCLFCFQKGILTPGKDVDHIDPLKGNDYTKNPKKAFGFDNLRYLCKNCHDKRHGRKGACTREGLRFNAAGELVKE